jgi:elongation factor P--beta-lysine ligase
VFRDGDQSPRHRQEFHLLEWYRTEDLADAVLRDVENLFGCCFAAAERPGLARWRRIGLLDLIEELLSLSLRGDEEADELHHRVAALRDGCELLAGAPSGPPSAARTLGTWDAFISAFGDRFLTPWLKAQPGVGVHLVDYPAVLCAMATTGRPIRRVMRPTEPS